jgi:hypothetical protein
MMKELTKNFVLGNFDNLYYNIICNFFVMRFSNSNLFFESFFMRFKHRAGYARFLKVV